MITPTDTTTTGSVTGGTVLAEKMTPDKTAPVVPTLEITATGKKNPLKDAGKSSAKEELEKRLGEQGVSETNPTEVDANDNNAAADEAKRKASEQEKRRAEKERKRREIVEAMRRAEQEKNVERQKKPRRLAQMEEKKRPQSDPDAWLKDIHPIQVK